MTSTAGFTLMAGTVALPGALEQVSGGSVQVAAGLVFTNNVSGKATISQAGGDTAIERDRS